MDCGHCSVRSVAFAGFRLMKSDRSAVAASPERPPAGIVLAAAPGSSGQLRAAPASSGRIAAARGWSQLCSRQLGVVLGRGAPLMVDAGPTPAIDRVLAFPLSPFDTPLAHGPR